MVALMMAVFFGILGLVVDLGFLMVHRRQQQNAADAAAMGVARLLAGSVGIDAGGAVNFVDQSDTTVTNRAQSLANGNWLGPASARSLTVEYLDCNGNVIRAASAGTNTAVPSSTCRVRATGSSTVNSFFIRAADPARTNSVASARATARIAPTSPPNGVSGLWPIARWIDHPTNGGVCAYVYGVPCVFWSNNGGSEDTSIGSFKEKLFFSRYSQCVYFGPPTAQLITAWDPNRPGQECASSAVQQADMEYWFRNGFGGRISVGDRIEVTDPGVQGSNYATPMRDYVNAQPEGTRAGWGNYRTVRVILWEDADRWRNNPPGFQNWPPGTAQPPDRIIVEEIRCFRFYEIFIDGSEVRGHFVSCYQDTPPQNGPPSGLANTVQMVN